MNALKCSNALLAAVLLAAASVLLAKSQASPGVVAAFAIPTTTFTATFLALQRGTKRLSNFALWLNDLLLTIYIVIDALALFAYNVQARNAAAIIAFQTVLIALPAIANIVALKRLRVAT